MRKSEAPAKKMTYEEFLEWCDEDTWAEWVDGEVVVRSPTASRHQVSPESRLRDRGEKFAEYEASGVREYWMIDPDRKEADFYLLDARGRFRLKEADPEGIYRSQALPGFWLEVDWLWQEPLPPVPEVLRELRLI